MIWVDTDGCESASEYCDLFLTSVIKRVDNAVFESIEEGMAGELSGEPYVGTLENEGVGVAPFHEFEGSVDAELQSELDQIREAIIAGDIVVESPASP